jgi:DNA repair protein RadC
MAAGTAARHGNISEMDQSFLRFDIIRRAPRRRRWQNDGMAILTARDAADLLAPLFGDADANGETLAVVHLDRDRRLIAIDMHPVTEADGIVLPMREIFGAALRHDATGMVIAHNHPSGDARPSRADIEATRRIAEAADALGIVLHDHLIFAKDDCQSLRQLGLL